MGGGGGGGGDAAVLVGSVELLLNEFMYRSRNYRSDSEFRIGFGDWVGVAGVILAVGVAAAATYGWTRFKVEWEIAGEEAPTELLPCKAVRC